MDFQQTLNTLNDIAFNRMKANDNTGWNTYLFCPNVLAYTLLVDTTHSCYKKMQQL
jgi:hypothetical protein